MSDDTQEHYDLEKVYDEQINPLMAQILRICKENNIPMLATFAYRHTEEETSYCTSYLATKTRSPIELLEAKLSVTTHRDKMVALTITTDPSKKS